MSNVPITSVESVTESVVLDTASSSANKLEAYRQDIADGRMLALDHITTFQFEPQAGRADALGSLEESSIASSELLGREVNPGGLEATPQQEMMMGLLNDMYFATMKMTVAWKLVDGVGKDTKAMLQAH